jgi:hypothetical protein
MVRFVYGLRCYRVLGGGKTVAGCLIVDLYPCTTRSATIRAKAIGSCFLRGRRQEGTWEQCSVENDWGTAEVLRKGSGIKVDGTAGDGLTISTYIKDAGNLHAAIWNWTAGKLPGIPIIRYDFLGGRDEPRTEPKLRCAVQYSTGTPDGPQNHIGSNRIKHSLTFFAPLGKLPKPS